MGELSTAPGIITGTEGRWKSQKKLSLLHVYICTCICQLFFRVAGYVRLSLHLIFCFADGIFRFSVKYP